MQKNKRRKQLLSLSVCFNMIWSPCTTFHALNAVYNGTNLHAVWLIYWAPLVLTLLCLLSLSPIVNFEHYSVSSADLTSPNLYTLSFFLLLDIDCRSIACLFIYMMIIVSTTSKRFVALCTCISQFSWLYSFINPSQAKSSYVCTRYTWWHKAIKSCFMHWQWLSNANWISTTVYAIQVSSLSPKLCWLLWNLDISFGWIGMIR